MQQFKRGPPSRNIKSPGNPINHTGYPDMAPQRNYKKTMSGKGGGGVPWAQVSFTPRSASERQRIQCMMEMHDEKAFSFVTFLTPICAG